MHNLNIQYLICLDNQSPSDLNIICMVHGFGYASPKHVFTVTNSNTVIDSPLINGNSVQ